jgi:hypothetical protein
LTLDTGWKKFGSGMQDNHPGSATLLKMNHFCGTDYNFINFFYFCGSFFVLLDPDPDWYGSRDPIESGSNPDQGTDQVTDPDPQQCFLTKLADSVAK